MRIRDVWLAISLGRDRDLSLVKWQLCFFLTCLCFGAIQVPGTGLEFLVAVGGERGVGMLGKLAGVKSCGDFMGP